METTAGGLGWRSTVNVEEITAGLGLEDIKDGEHSRKCPSVAMGGQTELYFGKPIPLEQTS